MGGSGLGTGFFKALVGEIRVAGLTGSTFFAVVLSPIELIEVGRSVEILEDFNPGAAGTFKRTVFKEDRPESTLEVTGFKADVDAEVLESKEDFKGAVGLIVTVADGFA